MCSLGDIIFTVGGWKKVEFLDNFVVNLIFVTKFMRDN